MDCSNSGEGQVAGSYEHGNEPSVSRVAEELLASKQGLYSMASVSSVSYLVSHSVSQSVS